MKTSLLFLYIFITTSLCSQNVYIPDTNFKMYLIGNTEINTNEDNETQINEAKTFRGIIDSVNSQPTK